MPGLGGVRGTRAHGPAATISPPIAGRGGLGAVSGASGGRRAIRRKKTKARGGGGGAKKTRAVEGSVAPTLKSIKTEAKPPPELTKYAKGYREDVLGGHAERLGELREKGGAFLEEAGRQGRESTTARIEEARRRAEEAGVPFDEQAALREALRGETGARSEGLQAAEERIDRALGAQTSAYQGGLPIVASPSNTALAQRAQSLNEQQALMSYWLGKENAATARANAAARQQAQWLSMLSSMLNTAYA